MIYRLKPATKDYLWGGERLREQYHIESDCHPLAEAWMLSCHPDGPSVVADGPRAGLTLPQLIEALGRDCLGRNCAGMRDFPVLIKLIDARDRLSLQVHPSDDYARAHEGQLGKTEMWLVLDCRPDAFLYYGFERPVTREEMAERIAAGTLTDVLHAAKVHPGDMFFIPAGTLHAIGRDILIAEVQQNSNVTYRVFDYNRVGADGKLRALHIDQALAVTEREPVRADWDFGGHLARCEYFTTDCREGDFRGGCGEESFLSLVILSGEGTLTCGGETVPFRMGDSFFLPAGSGGYEVRSSGKTLVTGV